MSDWKIVLTKREKATLKQEAKQEAEYKKAIDEAYRRVTEKLDEIRREKHERSKIERKMGILSIKTFMNRLTRGGRHVGKNCRKTRARVKEIEKMMINDNATALFGSNQKPLVFDLGTAYTFHHL
jgi:hypothetical protein